MLSHFIEPKCGLKTLICQCLEILLLLIIYIYIMINMMIILHNYISYLLPFIEFICISQTIVTNVFITMQKLFQTFFGLTNATNECVNQASRSHRCNWENAFSFS